MIALGLLASWSIVACILTGILFFTLARAAARRWPDEQPDHMPARWVEDFHKRVR